MNSAHVIGSYTPIHRLRLIVSFALLGAVLAGTATLLPVVALIPAAIDVHAVGAVLGGIAGTVAQALHR